MKVREVKDLAYTRISLHHYKRVATADSSSYTSHSQWQNFTRGPRVVHANAVYSQEPSVTSQHCLYFHL